MKRIDLLEIFFIITTIGGVSGAAGFGQLVKYGQDTQFREGVYITMDTGYNGGAMAMGLVGAMSLLCIALIEIARFKKSNTLN